MSFMTSFKGVLGETVINVAMWLKLDKEVYHRLNNITLPLANGGSTQIDHVIVSKYGIFVIETKNYKGWIFGSEKQQQWTQAFPNGRKYKFQNPLRQNYLHIKTLSDLLDLELSYFHSMIAFIGECELKTRDELPEHVLTSGMVAYVKSKQDKLFTDEEVKIIVQQIESRRFSKSWRTNRKQKSYLKNKHSYSHKSPSRNSNGQSVIQPLSKENAKRAPLKSREVKQWSGQTQVESFGIDEAITLPTNKLLHNQSASIDDKLFITPFAVVESELEIENEAQEAAFIKKIPDIAMQAPTCPKRHGEMVQRVAKKGARQGQVFYGCRQFPKCRGVVNVN